jgi:FMN-dependent NADH-azoreductase
MNNVLVITSSTSGAASSSSGLVEGFAASLQHALPATRIFTRDLVREPLPHLSVSAVNGIRGNAETLSEFAAQSLSDHLIEEVEASDLIVIASPMHNFGIASTLKVWFDYVLRAGKTFRYTANGPEGLLKGKRAIVVETRGGFYSEGPAKAMDSQEPHLRTLLNFVGITDVTFVRAERLSMGPDARSEALEQAMLALDGIARSYAHAA